LFHNPVKHQKQLVKSDHMSRYVSIVLDKERKLRLDINALAELEQASGHTLGELLSARVGISTLRAFLWAALRGESPDLSLKGAGILLQKYLEGDGTLEELADIFLKTVEASGLIKNRTDDDAGKALTETSAELNVSA
jgi:hypothetical protein